MSRDHHERHTARNSDKPGIMLRWTNLRGERPQSAQSRERDRRVAEIRGLLATVSDLSAAHIQAKYGLKRIETAETYLALAKQNLEMPMA